MEGRLPFGSRVSSIDPVEPSDYGVFSLRHVARIMTTFVAFIQRRAGRARRGAPGTANTNLDRRASQRPSDAQGAPGQPGVSPARAEKTGSPRYSRRSWNKTPSIERST